MPERRQLLNTTIAWIDARLKALEVERVELERQQRWLTAQRQELLDEAVGQRLLLKYPEVR